MKNKFVLLCFSLMFIFLYACGEQETDVENDMANTKQENAVAEETIQQTQTSDNEFSNSAQNIEKEQEKTTSNQDPVPAIKNMIISSSDYEYVFSDITTIRGDECEINNIFGFNLPSGDWYLYGFSGFNHDDPWNSRVNYTNYGGNAEEKLADRQIDCYQSLRFASGEINYDPCLHIALACENEISAADDQIKDVTYLKEFLKNDRYPENASIDSLYYELLTLEKKETLDTSYGVAQIIYQVTSHKINDNTYYESEREIVLLHLTDFHDLVIFDDTTKTAVPAVTYDILIEYQYPKTEKAGGYQHILVDMLPQILNKD
ncbi:MAG: hypothetical protein J6C64_11705 [Lachnospiraceae bacterium]|nr:hypothetical protein [Lachnospiraceae bacterium]